jgi:OmpA-OmpF porin, OOP family
MTRKGNQFFAAVFLFILSISANAQTAQSKYAIFAPNDKAEFGIKAGASYLVGDLESKFGIGVGAHIRKALDYTFSLRGDVNFQLPSGNTPTGVQWVYGGDAIKNLNADDPRRIDKYNTTTAAGAVNVVISLNNGRWDGGTRWLNPYVFGGVGASYIKTTVNVTQVVRATPGFTTGSQEFQIPGTRNTSNIAPHVEAGAGVAIRINDKMNFALEQKMSTAFGKRADLMDGYQFNARDFLSLTTVGLNFNLGGKDAKKTLPLWWAGPADEMNGRVAELEKRPKYDPTDTDNDGVIDMIDQEKESPAGARVDTRGVSVDSDGDSYPDYKDKEPFSPVGFKVDNNGVAMVPKPAYVTESDVNRIVDEKIAKLKATMSETSTATVKGMSDWFLPMIHYDLNSAAVKQSEYGNLSAVANVLKSNPGVRVVVTGFTDKSATDGYNQGLSYRRAQNAIDALVKNFGVDRSRLVLNYDGENNTLVPTTAANFMNRRVEFKVASAESEMSAPARGSKKSYKGNKSGY